MWLLGCVALLALTIVWYGFLSRLLNRIKALEDQLTGPAFPPAQTEAQVVCSGGNAKAKARPNPEQEAAKAKLDARREWIELADSVAK